MCLGAGFQREVKNILSVSVRRLVLDDGDGRLSSKCGRQEGRATGGNHTELNQVPVRAQWLLSADLFKNTLGFLDTPAAWLYRWHCCG